MILLFGIGDKFNRNRRSWIVKDIKEGNYTCETTDNKNKDKLIKIFTKNDIIKIAACD